MADPWEKDVVVKEAWQNDAVIKRASFQQTPAVFPKRSAREEKMAKQVVLTPEEEAADEADARRPENIALLKKELDAAKHPVAKEILQAEYDRLSPYLKLVGK